MRVSLLLVLVLLSSCLGPDRDHLPFETDPRILRGVWEGEGERDTNLEAVAVGPDGRWIAAVSFGELGVWDTRDGRKVVGAELAAAEFGDRSLAFSADGRFFAAVAEEGLTVWRLEDGAVAARLEQGGVNRDALALSADGGTLAAGVRDTVTLWDLATASTIRDFGGAGGIVGRLALSPDGRTLAADMGDAVRFWDVSAGALNGLVTGTLLAASPDSRWLAVATDAELKIVSAASGEAATSLESSRSMGWVGFSRDGALLLGASFNGSRLHLWEVASGALLQTFVNGDPIESFALSPDNTRVATGDGWNLKLWSVQEGGPVRTFEQVPGHPYALAFDADANVLVAALGFGSLMAWNLAAGGPGRALVTPEAVRARLELEALYIDTTQYAIAGSLSLGDEAPQVLEGTVYGGDYQRYMRPQWSSPRPPHLEAVVRDGAGTKIAEAYGGPPGGLPPSFNLHLTDLRGSEPRHYDFQFEPGQVTDAGRTE